MSIQVRDVLFYGGGECLESIGTLSLRTSPGEDRSSIETFARADTGTFISKAGKVRSAASGDARVTWLDLDGDGVREAYLLLEPAGENLVADRDLSTWSVVGTPVITDAVSDPAGGTNAFAVEDDAGGAAEEIYTTPTFTGDGTKCVSLYCQFATLSSFVFGIWDQTAGVTRHRIKVTFTDGVPALSTEDGSGTLYDVEALGGNWYRVSASVENVVAANTNRFYIYPHDLTAGAMGSVYIYGPQAEDQAYPSSYIPTTGSTDTRAADSIYFPFPFVPMEMTAYLKFQELGNIASAADLGLLHIGSATGTADPRFQIKADATGFYEVEHDNSVDVRTATLASAPPSHGDVVELRAVLQADGSVYIGQSINGATGSVTSASSAASPYPAWAAQRLYVNSLGSSSPGQAHIRSIKVVRGIQTMADLRALFA